MHGCSRGLRKGEGLSPALVPNELLIIHDRKQCNQCAAVWFSMSFCSLGVGGFVELDWCGCFAVCCGLGFDKNRNAACHSCIKRRVWFKCQIWWSGCLRCQFKLAMVELMTPRGAFLPLYTQTKYVSKSSSCRRACSARFEGKTFLRNRWEKKSRELSFKICLKSSSGQGSHGVIISVSGSAAQEGLRRRCGCRRFFFFFLKGATAVKQATHMERRLEECFYKDLFVFCCHPPPSYSIWVCVGGVTAYLCRIEVECMLIFPWPPVLWLSQWICGSWRIFQWPSTWLTAVLNSHHSFN